MSDVWELKIDAIISIPLSHLCPYYVESHCTCCIIRHQFRDTK
jgi:hypothetical protein